MELLMIAIIAIVVMIILGVSVLKIMMGVLWVMAGLSFLSFMVLFFALLLSLFTKRKEARFLGLEKRGKYGSHATYEVDGEKIFNAFPTDYILKDLLYRKENVKVRVGSIGKHVFAMDTVSFVVIGIGIPTFLLMTLGIILIIGTFV